MSNQVQNKPTAAYILSLLGGIFGLLMGLVYLAYGALTYGTFSEWLQVFTVTTMQNTMALGFSDGLGQLLFGIWNLDFDSIYTNNGLCRKLNSNPMEHSKWGALILVFSILDALSVLGALLAFIGGILALVYKPIPISGQPMYQQPYGQPQTYTSPPPPAYAQSQQPITRICPQCGRVVNENTKFCPHCGKQLN